MKNTKVGELYDKLKAENQSIDRCTLVLTIKEGEEIQLSNGVTLILRRAPRGGAYIRTVIMAPRDIKISRGLNEQAD